jgi:hypothetical protein
MAKPSYGDKRGKFVKWKGWVAEQEEADFVERLETEQDYPEGKPLKWMFPLIVFAIAVIGMCALTFALPAAWGTVAFFVTPFLLVGLYITWMLR